MVVILSFKQIAFKKEKSLSKHDWLLYLDIFIRQSHVQSAPMN